MTYRWLTDLDAVLTAGGVPYVEVGAVAGDATGSSSWRSRGRPASTGQFNPQGVLCHHTASPAGTSDQSDISVIIRGNSQAPGPISQLYLGRTSGVVYIIAAGRANHGGSGRRPGVDTGGCADMNAALLGIEAGNAGDGREVWPDVQTNLYAQLVAALCAGYRWSITSDVYLHATTGPPSGGCNSKIDPAGPWQGEPQCRSTWNLDTWRRFISDSGSSSVVPPTPQPQEGRRTGMSDFVVLYGMDAQGCPNGTVLEIVNGRKRWVEGGEFYEVLKGVIMDANGNVPQHQPWQPVAFVANGWNALALPDFDDATGRAVPTLDPHDAPD